ncbi:MAG: 6-phosphogluconolactonase [Kiritimatiellae bacterium]|nr:6-phosphogluconolactonase [Kiritimatiellia bacterium]
MEELHGAAADLLREHFQRAMPGGKPHAIMLSGGQTPQPVYDRIAGEPFTPPAGLHLFLSDERMVPAAHPDSNYGRCRRMFSALGLGPDRALRVRTELPLAQAAAAYGQDLTNLLRAGATVSLGLLGLGADGHTASLFSREDALGNHDRLVIPVHRPKPPDRVSVTTNLIARIEHVVLLVAGADKRDVVARLLADPDSTPAGLAVRGARLVEIWADRAASGGYR